MVDTVREQINKRGVVVLVLLCKPLWLTLQRMYADEMRNGAGIGHALLVHVVIDAQ